MYCSTGDVQNEFKSIDFNDANSAVTTSKVKDWINQASAEINSYLNDRYVVPVTTGTDGLLLLKQVCVWLVSDRIKEITEVKDVSPEANQAVKPSLRKKALDILNSIAKHDLDLIGATGVSGDSGLTSFVTSGAVFQRKFKREGEEW